MQDFITFFAKSIAAIAALRKANAAAAAEIRVAIDQLGAAMPRAQRLCAGASDLVRVRTILQRALDALTGPGPGGDDCAGDT